MNTLLMMNDVKRRVVAGELNLTTIDRVLLKPMTKPVPLDSVKLPKSRGFAPEELRVRWSKRRNALRIVGKHTFRWPIPKNSTVAGLLIYLPSGYPFAWKPTPPDFAPWLRKAEDDNSDLTVLFGRELLRVN